MGELLGVLQSGTRQPTGVGMMVLNHCAVLGWAQDTQARSPPPLLAPKTISSTRNRIILLLGHGECGSFFQMGL